MSGLLDELLGRVNALEPAQRAGVEQLAIEATAALKWVPNPGPQTEAYFCEADETLFGGEPYGGKSDLLLGLALNLHRRSLILRRVNKDVEDLGDRLVNILGTGQGYNSQRHSYRGTKGATGELILLSGCEHEKDKLRYKGKSHDLKAWDEVGDFLESQYLFINGWTRTTVPGQRCRIVATTNGPTTPEAQWIVQRWAAWLDPAHPNPAKSGEIRWYIRIDDREIEVDGPGPHVVEGRAEPVRAKSRTFIRSYLADNPDASAEEYRATLDGMAENDRRAIGRGDFTVGLGDDDYQLIPTSWIELAMERWAEQPPKGVPMTAMAVDVAQGGNDFTAIARRYDGWFAPIDVEPGAKTREGHAVMALVMRRRKDRCPVIIDIGGGYGADALKVMAENGIDCAPFNGVLASNVRTRVDKVKLVNKRAEAYWKMREALDPEQEGGSIVALPNDPILKADLAAVRRKPLTPRGLVLEEKADIKARIGRSPDRGDAVVMCLAEGMRAQERGAAAQHAERRPTEPGQCGPCRERSGDMRDERC